MTIDKDRAQRLREMLLERKRRLWNDLRDELFRGAGENLHTQFEVPQDIGEKSLLSLLADAELSVADIRLKELEQMEVAERKFREGSYGTCDDCGRKISEERLAVLPFACCCTDCQGRREEPSYGPGRTL